MSQYNVKIFFFQYMKGNRSPAEKERGRREGERRKRGERGGERERERSLQQ